MKYSIHDIRTFALIFCMLGVGLQVRQAAGQSVNEILSAHIDAIGGKDKILAVNAIHPSGDVRFNSEFTGTLDGNLEMLVIPRKKMYQSSQMGPYTTTTAWDGETAWENGAQGLRTLSGGERSTLLDQSRMFFTTGLWRSNDQTIKKLDDHQLHGKPHFVLEYDGLQASKVTVYLDAETYLVSQMKTTTEIPGYGPSTIMIRMGDYASHDGIVLAQRVTSRAEGVFSSEIQFSETSINAPYEDSIFTKPGS